MNGTHKFKDVKPIAIVVDTRKMIKSFCFTSNIIYLEICKWWKPDFFQFNIAPVITSFIFEVKH